MRLLRVRHPDALMRIENHIIEDTDYFRDQFIIEIGEFMVRSPDSVVFLILFDDEHFTEPAPVAYVIGYKVPTRKQFFILQAWCDPTLYASEWPKKIEMELVSCVSEMGCDELRAETRRSPRAFLRRWGFEEYSTVMRRVLKET